MNLAGTIVWLTALIPLCAFLWTRLPNTLGLIGFVLAALLVLIYSTRLHMPLLLMEWIPLSLTGWLLYRAQEIHRDRLGLAVADRVKVEEQVNLALSQVQQFTHAVQTLTQRYRRLSDLQRVMDGVGGTLVFEEVAQRVADLSAEIQPAPEVLVYWAGAGQALGLVARLESGSRREWLKTGGFLEQWALRNRQGICVADLGDDFRFDVTQVDAVTRQFRSHLVVPMMGHQRLLGVLHHAHPDPGQYHVDDLRTLDVVASLAGVAFQNAEFFRQTENLAIRDGLTGLYVQRYFKERLTRELDRAERRPGGRVALLICDLDHFKRYNDQHGHMAGDQLLRRVSQVVGDVLREGEFAARYGGEEIALVFPQVPLEEAVSRADALRQTIQAQVVTLRRIPTSITVSIGVAVSDRHGRDYPGLFSAADRALYQAKAAGRNRVTTAPPADSPHESKPRGTS